MNKPTFLKYKGYQYLIAFTFFLLIGEAIFRHFAESEIEETIVKVFLIGLPLTFAYFGFNWARWTTSILLFLYGLISIGAGFEIDAPILWFVGVFYLFFGTMLIFSKEIKKIFNRKDIASNIVSDENETVIAQDFDYPYLLTRVKASAIDGILLVSVLGILLLLVQDQEYRPIIAIMFLVIAVLYEPISLSVYSATLGHKLMGIKVINVNDKNKKLNLLQGVIRIIIKFVLGWLSFITINFNPGHRAIHDYLSSGIVIKK